VSGFWLGHSAEKKAGHPAFCEREIIEAVRRHGRTKPKYPQEKNAQPVRKRLAMSKDENPQNARSKQKYLPYFYAGNHTPL